MKGFIEVTSGQGRVFTIAISDIRSLSSDEQIVEGLLRTKIEFKDGRTYVFNETYSEIKQLIVDAQ